MWRIHIQRRVSLQCVTLRSPIGCNKLELLYYLIISVLIIVAGCHYLYKAGL
jgi:hypothetical protein